MSVRNIERETKFVEGAFEIAVGGNGFPIGKTEVEGWISGPFGIHEDFDIMTDKTSYILSNIPLGYQIAKVRSISRAMNLAHDLSHLNWEFKTLDEFMFSETRKLAVPIRKKYIK